MIPLCLACTRLREGEFACDAYPAGIPHEILDGMHDHRKPFPGDNKKLFDQLDKTLSKA
jgi:hypothetical protein